MKRARCGVSFFGKALAQCAADFNRLGFSGVQGIPDCFEISRNSRFLVPSLRHRILEEFRKVEITALAAANPEVVWENRVEPRCRRFDLGDGPRNVDRGVGHWGVFYNLRVGYASSNLRLQKISAFCLCSSAEDDLESIIN